MKKLVIFRSVKRYLGLLLLILVSCESFDDLPEPVLTRYTLPTEILEKVFTSDIPKSIYNVDNFLDRIKQNGMVIHEGDNPPYIFDRLSEFGPRFEIGNNCIYDGNNPKNNGFSYGNYEETIRIFADPMNQRNFLAEITYTSILNPNFPEFHRGFDTGSGRGYVSGDGENFTIFLKTTNGNYDDIIYKAIWIISGTYTLIDLKSELTNVTKCMVMLQKDNDPEDLVANRGTVRIFKDDSPRWLPY